MGWVFATVRLGAAAGVDAAVTVASRASVAVVASAASVDPPVPVGVARGGLSAREACEARRLRRRTCASASRAAKRFAGRPDGGGPPRVRGGFFWDVGEAFLLGMGAGLVSEAAS